MTREILYKHYQRILAKWPVDLLRPEVSFQTVMRRRIDKRFLPLPSQPTKGVGTDEASVAPAQGQHVEEKAEFEQVNVLYSLLENRYSKKYSLSETLMKPASNPTYYQDLLKELQEAPQRSWFGRIVNSWKGFLRFS